MKIGLVSGNVVSTINHPFFDSQRLMICDLIGPDGAPLGGYTIAVDTVDAGVGDTVLIIDEGTSARQMFGVTTGPIRAVIAGIIDSVDME